MKNITITSVLAVVLWGCTPSPATSQAPSAEEQVAAAVQAAPPEMREDARVLGYANGDELVTLREGNGPLICLADAPGDDQFHVACYHQSLEPFMSRGRELEAQGLSHSAVDSTRRAEINAGVWKMPSEPATLYTLSGPAGSYNAEADTVTGGRPLHVVYIPYATAASTGLPRSAAPGEPWIMEPGAPWAHIMITAPKEEK